eukprot:1372242-Pyramimonas_sp.AAC.1
MYKSTACVEDLTERIERRELLVLIPNTGERMVRAKGLFREQMPSRFVFVKQLLDRVLGGTEGDVAAGLAHLCPICNFDA